MVTRNDVARKAGVSPATVSRVLGGYRNVREDHRRLVLSVAAELGYRPNQTARSLRTGRTNRIGLIVSNLINPYYTEVISGVEEVARREGYVVSVCDALYENYAYLRAFAAQQWDGLIIAASNLVFREIGASLMPRQGIPVVLGPELTEAGSEFPRIKLDWELEAEKAVTYLLGLGHRHVAFVSETKMDNPLNGRHNGYRRALAAAGVEYDPALCVSCFEMMGSPQLGLYGVRRLLARGVKPTAIFAANDLIAMGAIAALAEAHLNVPEDISVLGFDDLSFAAMTTPALSTVAVPKWEQGRMLAEMLLNTLSGVPPRTEALTGSIIVRQSTAPPAR